MFSNTIGALLANHVVQLSCPQSPLFVHAASELLQRGLELPVGHLLSCSLYGVFFCGRVRKEWGEGVPS